MPGDVVKRLRELIFEARDAKEGGYVARAVGESIFVEAEDRAGLESEIRDAVECHFGNGPRPKVVRLRFAHGERLPI